MYRTNSPIATVIGATVAAVAVVGTQFLGWEWGSGQLLPTVLGLSVAVVAVVLVAKRALS